MTDPECLPFREIPHTTRLFADFTADFPRVAAFYPRPPQYPAWLAEEAKKLGSFDRLRRQSLAAILEAQNKSWNASPETLKNISRLRSGACAIVTGQQAILFGGPIYSLYKALTAIKLAAEATRAGHDCVPIFWLATQDHDFEEVRHATLRSAAGELRTFSLPPSAPEATPLSAIPMPAAIASLAAEAAAMLGAGEAADWLRQSYVPGETLGSALARFFLRVFAAYGLIVLDPSHSGFHPLSQPLYGCALENSEAITNALLQRNQALEAAGYHAQVKVTTTLLFAMHEGQRVPVRRSNGKFSVAEQKFSPSELFQEVSQHPEAFSPNVLLRPVLQDFLVPTLAYVGGPSEIAYFAQAAVVYQKLLGRVTPILPRFSATLCDARSQRLLQRYQLSLRDVFSGPEHLRELLASRGLPQELESDLAAAEENLQKSMASVTESLTRLDSTLRDAAQHAGSKMRYQLEQLRGRAARARLRRHDELARHASQLSLALYPNQNLQEREIAGASYLAQFGLKFLARLYDAISSTCAGHNLINIS